MKDKNKKFLLGFIILCAILLVICIIILIKRFSSSNENDYDDTVEAETTLGDEDIEYNSTKERLANSEMFFSIESYINDYLYSIYTLNVVKLVDVLNEDYLNTRGLTIENIKNNSEEYYAFRATEIYETRNSTLYSYIVKGVKDDGIYEDEKYYIFDLDLSNYAYKITPLYEYNYTNIDQISSHELKEIEVNDYNAFDYIGISDEEIAQKHMEYYTNLMKNNTLKAYEMLDEQYKEARFQNSYNNFVYYVTKMTNANKIDTDIKSVSTGITSSDNEYYYAITKNDNRFKFIIAYPMDFTVILDEYTILSDTYKTKYSSSDVTQKLNTDVDKVMKMINTYDYVNLYNMLDETYKANFDSINTFIQYISDNFYDSNIYTIKTLKTSNEQYIAEIIVYKDNTSTSESNYMDIIINLGNGTDFTVSFEK